MTFAACGPAPSPHGSGAGSATASADAPRSATPAPTASSPGGPFLRVLGVAQDGGLPHAGCEHDLCRRARLDPALASPVASLGVIVPAENRNEVFLVDATPDVRQQLDLLRDVRQPPVDRVDRAPLAGVLLTHAHIGHYAGLVFFGFEAIHTRGLPVYATPAMASFLRANGPWSQLVEMENIALREQPSGSRFALGDGDGAVEVGVIAVPHRDELSDTVGFVFAGPERRVLYVPDTDGWQHWDPPLPEVLAAERVDIALLDGSFYSMDELPGRDIATIRHPLVTQSMDLLAAWVAEGGTVLFIHLNHSNPALDPASDARSAIRARGFAVATVGQEIAL